MSTDPRKGFQFCVSNLGGLVKARNDRHDTNHVEAKLISVGHHLVRFARLRGQTVTERTAFWEAAETVWKAKREYRAELRLCRVERAKIIAAHFRNSTKEVEA